MSQIHKKYSEEEKLSLLRDFLLPIKELLIYFTLHNDVIRTFLRFLSFHILHLFEILHDANIHLFEIFCKSFDEKA